MYTHNDGTLNFASSDFIGCMPPWVRDYAAVNSENVIGVCSSCAASVLYGDYSASPEAYDWSCEHDSNWALLGEVDVYGSWICECCRTDSAFMGFSNACALYRVD